MTSKHYTFRAKVWLYPGMAGWHFVTLPQKESDIIKDVHGWGRRGFGSIPVMVTVGKTSWKTSIFPDNKADAYILPLKSEVRKAENIKSGDSLVFSIEICT